MNTRGNTWLGELPCTLSLQAISVHFYVLFPLTHCHPKKDFFFLQWLCKRNQRYWLSCSLQTSTEACSIFQKCTIPTIHICNSTKYYFPFLWGLWSFPINCIVFPPWQCFQSIVEYCTMAGHLELYMVLIREVSLGTVFDWIDTRTFNIKRWAKF